MWCRLEDGVEVVWKLANVYSTQGTELFSEAAGYGALKSLQGTVLPRMLDFGLVHGGMGLALTITRVWGRVLDLRKDVPLFPKVRMGLGEIHGLGVLHGDIRCANIMVAPKENPQDVVFVDFGRCRVNPSESDLRREFNGLEKMLARGVDS